MLSLNNDGACWALAGSLSGGTPESLVLTALRRAASFSSGTATISENVPAGTLMTIATAQIARAGQREAPPATGTVTFLDRRTLRTSTHAVTAHPYDVPARPRTPWELQAGRPLTREELAGRWQRVSDARFGAVAGLDDSGFRQLPLKVMVARLSDPCDLLPEPPAVAGTGVNRENASERAMTPALAAYASIVVDPRLLTDREGNYLGACDDDAGQLLRTVRDGSARAFVRATDLADGRERLLPAEQAFPVLRTPSLRLPSLGVSAGLSWRQAVTHGLLQHCAELTVSGSAGHGRSELAAEDFGQDPDVEYLAAMARAAGLDLILHDITGPIGVPVVACGLESGKTEYGAGADLAEAVKEALTARLYRYQLQHDPLLRAAVTAPVPAVWTNPLSPDSADPDQLVRALTNLGHTPSVVVLDHDRAVSEAVPYLARVLLN
jgi:hypothetical protein